MSETDQQSRRPFSRNATKDNRKTNDVHGDGCKGKRRRNASYLSAKKARNPGVNDRPGGSARGGKLGRGGLSLNNARGFPCVVGTCEPGKEKDARKELLALLEEEAERSGLLSSAVEGTLSNECDDNTASLSIEEKVRRETDFAHRSHELFPPVHLDMRGVMIIAVTQKGIDVLKLIQGIFEYVSAVKKRISRFIIRISPLNRTCYGNVGEIVKLAKTVIDPGFSSLKEPMTWSIHLNRRNSSAKRNDIIAGVAELVDKKHKVSLGDPSIVTLIEVIMGLAGITLVKDWPEKGYEDFNLKKWQDTVSPLPIEGDGSLTI
eukprot:16950_1